MIDVASLRKELSALRAEPEDDRDEDRLVFLSSLFDAFSGYEPASIIPEDEWEEYCQDYAEEIYLTGSNNPIAGFIDWDGWASAMAQDYMTVDVDGVTYYYR